MAADDLRRLAAGHLNCQLGTGDHAAWRYVAERTLVARKADRVAGASLHVLDLRERLLDAKKGEHDAILDELAEARIELAEALGMTEPINQEVSK